MWMNLYDENMLLICAMHFYEPQRALSWIQTYKNHPYFFTTNGESWIPVGQNDAITWPELRGVFMNKDIQSVERYFQMLVKNGVNCMRLMLEYCHGESRYFEKPAGNFQPNMVAVWDTLFKLANKYGIRFLITPFDTYWMRRRWKHHPYNTVNGGPCPTKSQWLLSKSMRTAIRNRLAFVTERWGKDGAIFAWDLWNEIHPVHARNEVEQLSHFIDDIGGFLRKKEIQLYGRAHLQTVSFYGVSLLKDERIASTAFHHPLLDFATIHLYDEPAIDRPKNSIGAAVACGRLTRKIISEISDNRPFFDSEHGPIYTYNKRRKMLDESFDNEYFANMQWAHFASGGAGGGMRWPYRRPHVLTAGMRRSQYSLSEFIKLVDWKTFSRKSLNDSITFPGGNVLHFSCGDEKQAIIWLLNREHSNSRGRQRKYSNQCTMNLSMPSGKYKMICWNTDEARIVHNEELNMTANSFYQVTIPPFQKNLALLITQNSI